MKKQKENKEHKGYWMWELFLDCPHCKRYIVELDKLIPGEKFTGEIVCTHCRKKFLASIKRGT